MEEKHEELVPLLMIWRPWKVGVPPKTTQSLKVVRLEFMNFGCISAKINPQDALLLRQTIGAQIYYTILTTVLQRVFVLRLPYEVMKWLCLGVGFFYFYNSLLLLVFGELEWVIRLGIAIGAFCVTKLLGAFYSFLAKTTQKRLSVKLREVFVELESELGVKVSIGSYCEWIEFLLKNNETSYSCFLETTNMPAYPPTINLAKQTFNHGSSRRSSVYTV